MIGTYQPYTFKTQESPITLELVTGKYKGYNQNVKAKSKWFSSPKTLCLFGKKNILMLLWQLKKTTTNF